MTQITHRLEVHCPYVRALGYFDKQLARLGWSERSNVVLLRLRVPLGASGVGRGLAVDKEVVASLKRSQERRGLEERIAVSWRPVEDHEPFPRFEGMLSLAAASPKASTLTLDGRYEPPLGVAGKVFDATAGRRIAEATVHQLLKDIGGRIELEYAQDEPHLSR